MSFLNTLKGAIFEEAPASEAKPSTVAATATPSAASSVGTLPAPISTGVNPEFVAAIRKSVFGRNTALTQLMAAADKLANIIPDPSTRLKAAFATVGDGRTPRQITEAVDVHLSDVDGEELKFKNVIDNKIAAEVGGLEQQAIATQAQIDRARADIENAQRRISELNTMIAESSTLLAQTQAGASQKRQELEQASTQFKLAANAVRQELQATKSTISSALS